jgi:hypothetical protein
MVHFFVRPHAWLLLAAGLCSGCTSTQDGERLPDGGLAPPRVHQYIRKDPFPRLVLEVDSVAGKEPNAQAQSEVLSALTAVLDKPGGLQATADEAIASKGTNHAWTFDELNALAQQRFNLQVPADTTKMWIGFVDGHSAEDSGSGKILGLAWANKYLVMFKQTIEEVCSNGVFGAFRETLCMRAERAIWLHEVGHLIGLVDNGLPMAAPHKDPDHGAHDSSDACVMYWAYEGEQLVNVLRDQLLGGGAGQITFDTACQNDIAALRNAP